MANDPNAAVNYAMLAGGMYGPNQYSQYQGRIPFPGYVGTPTDAMGNPIQQAPGTTLNSTPAAAAPAAAAPTGNIAQQMYQMTPGQLQAVQALMGQGNIPAMYFQPGEPGYAQLDPSNFGTPSPTAAAAPATPAGQPSMQSATSLLANPGKVTTPGATTPQSTIGGQPSVLQQFLANQKGGTGAGNYSNQGFFNTLNALRGR